MQVPQIVFVALGRIPAYAEYNFSWAYRIAQEGFKVVIITDQRRHSLDNRKFTVVPAQELISREDVDVINKALTKSGKNIRWRKAYWPKVIQRFLALREYSKSLPQSQSLVHLENDVVSFLTEAVLSGVQWSQTSVLTLREDERFGPGTMFASSPQLMYTVCNRVVQLVVQGDAATDMDALGMLAQEGLIKSLPQHPTLDGASMIGQSLNSGEVSPYYLIFDPILVGQFLFGIDPRNMGGIRVPGIRLIRGDNDAAAYRKWHVVRMEDGISRVGAQIGDDLVSFVSLHVHSKTRIPKLHDTEAWKPVLSAANGLTAPQIEIDWAGALRQGIRQSAKRVVRGASKT